MISLDLDISEIGSMKDKLVQSESLIQSEEMIKDNNDTAKVEIEFLKYPCFYCWINVANEYHLFSKFV